MHAVSALGLRRIPLFACLLIPALLDAQSPEHLAPEWSALLFGNFQLRTDSAARAPTGGKPFSRFDMGRAYLTFRAPAGDRASIRITTDIFQNSSDGFYDGWAIRLKYGILQYDLTRNLAGVEGLAAVARIGMLHTVAIEHVETFWPRWLGNTALELNGFFSSSDVGAASLLTLPGRRGEVYATVTNGAGYSNPESDRFKDVAARFSWRPFAGDSGFFSTFTISPWYYKGWNASEFAAGGAGQIGPVTEGLQKDRRGVFAGVRDRRLTIGAEYSQRVEEVETGDNTLVAPRTVTGRTGTLTSAFAIARPVEFFTSRDSRLALVARADRFALDDDADARNQFVVAGATWDLNSRVTVALDYQALTAHDGSPAIPTQSWYLHWTASF